MTLDKSEPKLATPPAECDTFPCPLSSFTLQDVLATPSAMSKGGDAIGQPRKTPARPRVPVQAKDARLDVRPPSRQTAGKNPAAHGRIAVIATESPRGTKRGIGTTPLTQTSSVDQIIRTPPPTAHIPQLHRPASASTVMSSMSERDIRPLKRRPAPHTTAGLTSPPPSRETSPEEIAAERRSRIPIRSRIYTPRDAENHQSPPKAEARSHTPVLVNRNFLPVRSRPTPLQGIKPINDNVPYRPQESAQKPTKETETTRRAGLTPPRFARGIYDQLSRIRGTPPSGEPSPRT